MISTARKLTIGVIFVLFFTTVAVVGLSMAAIRAPQQFAMFNISSAVSSALSANSSAAVLPASVQVLPLEIAVKIDHYEDNGDGTWTVAYSYTISNPSSIKANFISANAIISQAKPGGVQFSILSFTSPDLNLKSNFNGSTHTQMLAGANVLNPGAQKHVYFTVRVNYKLGDTNVLNHADVYGEGLGSSSSSTPTSSHASTPTGSSHSATSSASSSPEVYQDEDQVVFGPATTNFSKPPCCQK